MRTLNIIRKEDEHRILDLRTNRNLGHRSIASEMKRLYEYSISTATVHKILKKNNKQYLKLKRYYRKKQTQYHAGIFRFQKG